MTASRTHGWRTRLRRSATAIALIWALLGAMLPGAVLADHDSDGRWVYMGRHAEVVRCEMGPTGNAQVRSWLGAGGPWQIMPETWDRMNGKYSWPEGRRDKPHLVGQRPEAHTLPQQYRVVQTLRHRVVGGGNQHWDCHRWGLGRFGPTDDPWVWMYNINESPHPRKCTKNLRRHWGASKKVARSLCNHPDAPVYPDG